MKAIMYERYGPPEVLKFTEIPKPSPREREVLIRVHATTVTSGDWRARSLDVPKGFWLFARLAIGVFGPRQPILGTELSGEIESIGRGVTKFKVGEPVFAFPGLRFGSYAEFKIMPEDGVLAPKPTSLSYEEAAALSFGGTTALWFLRRAKIQKGDAVLINGASGGVGTAAVQLAKHFGAEVTGVCSAHNLELVKSLGADKVIDYTHEDFTKNGETYDLIMDTAGTAGFARSRGSLKEGGRLLLVLGLPPDMLRAPGVALTTSKRIVSGSSRAEAQDLRFLASLAKSGQFKPVIDRRYPFDRIVEAHRYVDTGHKRGNVVITLDNNPRR